MQQIYLGTVASILKIESNDNVINVYTHILSMLNGFLVYPSNTLCNINHKTIFNLFEYNVDGIVC